VVSCGVAAVGFVAQIAFGQRVYAVPYQWRRMVAAAFVMFGVSFIVIPLGLRSGGTSTLGFKSAAFVTITASIIALLLQPRDWRAALAWIRALALDSATTAGGSEPT
jgi:hypothetical protein